MGNKGFSYMWLILMVAFVGFLAILVFTVLNLSGIGEPQTPVESPAIGDSQIKELETLSDSDEINVIESELNNTNVESIDAGLDQEVKVAGY